MHLEKLQHYDKLCINSTAAQSPLITATHEIDQILTLYLINVGLAIAVLEYRQRTAICKPSAMAAMKPDELQILLDCCTDRAPLCFSMGSCFFYGTQRLPRRVLD